MNSINMKSFFQDQLLRSESNRAVYTSLLCALLILSVRFFYTGSLEYLFLTWNIFLAYIPFLLSSILFSRISILDNRYWFTIISLAWMAMIPNSFYILTDFYHLHLHRQVPRWFDLLLILSFAWTGLLMGVLSLRRMETFMRIHLGRQRTEIFVLIIMWLIAFGIYLGRYLRFNSWDVLSDPLSLFSSLYILLTDPIQYLNTWAMTFFFGVFLYVMYVTIKRLSRAFY